VLHERTAEEIIMDARFNYYGNSVAAKFTKYINSAGAVISNSSLPAAREKPKTGS
jgi:hypothetical protein